MRLFGAFILSLIISAPLILKTVAFTDFLVNKGFIVKELCKQKEFKNNTCQGKCYLKKQLAKVDGINAAEEQVPNPTEKSINSSIEVNALLNGSFLDISPSQSKLDKKIKYQPDFYNFRLINIVIPPPKNA